MSPILIEIIGISATIFVIISLLFKTTTIKGSIMLRCFNLVGCTVFIIYGILLPTISTAILNSVCLIVDIYQLIVLLKDAKKSKESKN